MIKLFISAFCLTSCFCSYGQLTGTDLSVISNDLLTNAHAIKREEKIEFEVRSVQEARLTVHQVITVLDIAGEENLLFVQYTDQFRSLEEAEIKVFSATGGLIKKYKKKDLNAESVSEGLIEDDKLYFMRVTSPSFPITVQYDYQIQYSGTLNYPDFDIQKPGQSVIQTSYTARVPSELDLRYKAKNFTINPAITSEGNIKIYKWEAKNIPAVKSEEGSVSFESSYPKVLISPNKFDMDGNMGDLTSWKNFGQWYTDLTRTTLNLPQERKQYLQALVQNTTDSKEKTRLVYQYLQKNFRYVSIQLGIGGFQPFPAEFVDRKKYGDCKALSNYTQACLAAVGIRSYQALINASYNKEPVDPNFPHNSFNHVIICVPAAKDTTWLECTSNTEDFGVLGSFTENRYALLITENGGVLVRTPVSTSSENSFHISTTVQFAEDGSGESNSRLTGTGEYKEELIGSIRDEKKDDQQKYLVNILGFPQPDAFELKTLGIESEASLKLELEKVPSFSSGGKMFLNPRMYKLWNTSLPMEEKRVHDFYFYFPFQKLDTTVYKVPEGFVVESLPKPRVVKFELGSFRTNYVWNEKDRTITTLASFILTQNRIPAEKYLATRNFLNEVLEEYNDKIVIRKN